MSQRIITIGRRYGSGGRRIGRLVAEKLGLPFFDKEIITRAAKESGLCDEFMENFEQTPTSSLLYSLVLNAQNGAFFGGKPVELVAYEAQINAVRSAAAGGECVIVGRCADYILKDEYDVASFFITGPLDWRVKNTCEWDGISEKEALAKMNRIDKARASYHNYHADTKWGAADAYEVCLSPHKMTFEHAADIIIDYLSARNNVE